MFFSSSSVTNTVTTIMNTLSLSGTLSLVILISLLNEIRSEVQVTRIKDENGGRD